MNYFLNGSPADNLEPLPFPSLYSVKDLPPLPIPDDEDEEDRLP